MAGRVVPRPDEERAEDTSRSPSETPAANPAARQAGGPGLAISVRIYGKNQVKTGVAPLKDHPTEPPPGRVEPTVGPIRTLRISVWVVEIFHRHTHRGHRPVHLTGASRSPARSPRGLDGVRRLDRFPFGKDSVEGVRTGIRGMKSITAPSARWVARITSPPRGCEDSPAARRVVRRVPPNAFAEQRRSSPGSPVSLPPPGREHLPGLSPSGWISDHLEVSPLEGLR